MKKLTWWSFILCSILLTTYAYAGGVGNLRAGRCESTKKLVKLGDHYSVVIKKCGPPDSVVEIGSTTTKHGSGTSTYIGRDGRVVKRYGKSKSNTVYTIQVTYLNGWKKRPLILTIKGGIVKSIKLGDI